MAYTRIWDESLPKDQDRVYTGALEIRSLKVDFRERVNNRCPIGCITEWPTETVPDMWLECDGSSLLMASYPDLYATIGTTFGSADATHFNIPDLRGIFVRTWPNTVTSIDPDVAATSFTATTSNGSPTLTPTVMTILPRIGATITGSGIPDGTTVADVDVAGATITMSANATASATITVTINNNLIGTRCYDQVYRHTHQISTYVRLNTYVETYYYGYCWDYTAGASSSSGGTEVRPNNTNIMYIIRATAL